MKDKSISKVRKMTVLVATALLVFSVFTVGASMFVSAEDEENVYNVDQETWYETIQGAIDAAEPGHTLEVTEGTYEVDETIHLKEKEDIKLEAVGEVIITPKEDADLDSTNTLVIEDSSDITVTGFKAIEFLPTDGANAISIRESENVLISENTFEATLDEDDDTGEWKSTGVVISGDGTWYEPSSDITIKDNTFDLLGPETVGLGFYGFEDEEDLTVEGNYFRSAGKYHVYEMGTDDYDEHIDFEPILENNEFDRAVVVRGGEIKVHTIFTSIQDAIDAAEEGDTIEVEPGTYDGFTVYVEGLNIMAVETGESIITNEIVTISAPDVTLDGFVVEDIPTFETTQDAAGILVTASGVTVRNNIVRNLDADSTVNEVWMAANGIQVFNNDDAEEITDINIENNLVENIDSYGYDLEDWVYGAGSAGIKIQGNVRNVEVQDNEVRDIWSEGWSWGITVTDTEDLDPKEVTITMNSLEDISADELYGIAFGSEADASEVIINENDVWTETMDYGVQNKDTENILDATKNFWDSTDEDEIIYHDEDPDDQGEVDIVPYYEDEDRTELDGPVYNVDQNSYYDTIQGAIDDAEEGATIEVEEGTYEEPQIVIDKNLTIEGEDKETTIIKPAEDTGTSGDDRGWFLVDSYDVEFNLSNVTLDGEGKNIWQAIRAYGTGTIDNNIIKNMGHDTQDNMGFGIAVFGNMVISNNHISNIERVGISIFDMSLYLYDEPKATDVVVTGNTIIGMGPDADILGYGIELDCGANATISNNTFRNWGPDTTDWASAAILVHDAFSVGVSAEATITSNTIEDNEYGIYVGYYGDAESIVVANSNNIQGNAELGARAWADEDEDFPSTLDFTNNWWGDDSGPYHEEKNPNGQGDSVSDNVSFSPWLDDEYPDGEPKAIRVPDDFTTIQDAINAMGDGDTIEVGPDTYEEDITIDKGITLEAESEEVVIDGKITIEHEGAMLSGFTILDSADVGVQVHDETGEADLESILEDNDFDRAVTVRENPIVVPTIYSSIQDAIDAADSGDTVLVEPGTYKVDSRISVDESLTLTTDEEDPAHLIYEEEESTASVIGIHAEDVTVENFIVERRNGYMGSEAISVRESGATIRGTYIFGDALHGIHVTDGYPSDYGEDISDITIEDNLIQMEPQDEPEGWEFAYAIGAYVYGESELEVTIEGNRIEPLEDSEYHIGIDVFDSGLVETGGTLNIDITNNTIEGAEYHGVRLIGAEGTFDVAITENTLMDNGYGVTIGEHIHRC